MPNQYTPNSRISRVCPQCDNAFMVARSVAEAGKGRFCSRACAFAGRTPHTDPIDRLAAKVAHDHDTGCWLFTGTLTRAGYGQLYMPGETLRSGSRQLAHRVSWRLYRGPIPEGMAVLHHCDTPACVNPDHLFLGSHTDNMRDMHRKGRSVSQVKPELHARGERQHLAKLTADQVLEIRHLRSVEHLGLSQIGDQFGVTKSAVWAIVNGRTWRHV